MANMQARARMLGGQLIVQNGPGRGLQLELVVPCDGSKVPLPDTAEE
jgi:signal transduction histidine kinase